MYDNAPTAIACSLSLRIMHTKQAVVFLVNELRFVPLRNYLFGSLSRLTMHIGFTVGKRRWPGLVLCLRGTGETHGANSGCRGFSRRGGSRCGASSGSLALVRGALHDIALEHAIQKLRVSSALMWFVD